MAAPAFRKITRLAATGVLLLVGVAGAAVLPDDRADIFYSHYNGGGMDITGESVLVRKKFSEQFAVEASYFVDKVSGASVDVLSNASPIKDERRQKNISVDYIHDKTTYNLSYSNSAERDYTSNTEHFSLSQDMFGDLTTVSFGFTESRDKVEQNVGGDGTDHHAAPNIVPVGHAESRSYQLGLTQILTKNLLAGATLEVITDEGYLANPYRSVRYCTTLSLGNVCEGSYSSAAQIYPNTRTSTAVEARAKYYLPYRAAVTGTYRYFNDTWGITGHTAELDYTHPISNLWILEGRVRYYTQNHAVFYSDLFPFANAQNFEARDKDLAAGDNTTIGLKATYAFLPDGWKIFKRGTVTGDVSRIKFRYSDFRDIKGYTTAAGYQPGTEPEYQFSATVFQIYMSMFF